MSRTDLLERTARLRRERSAFVSATVVRAEAPTSAKPGDAAIVLGDGTIIGFVGGQCAESTVRLQALRTLASGETALVSLSPEPAVPTGERVTAVNPCASGGTLEIFLEPNLPPPLVLVVGEAPIARALVAFGEPLGYQVEFLHDVTQPLPADTGALVVASHGRDEIEALAAGLRADVPYVGLVASRRRGAAVLAQLPFCEEHRGRVRTPAGLDLGARTPGEVALSILAEIVALRSRGEESAEAVEDDPAPHPPAVDVPVATDPVCGMQVACVESSLHLDHDGERVWFCGPGCRQAFADEAGVPLVG